MKRIKIISVTMLFVFISIVALAAKGPANITVTYNNIKLVVEGVTVTPSVEPFILKDGKIGVSAEDIAKALGKEIKYDTKTSTLFIGRQPSGSWCYLICGGYPPGSRATQRLTRHSSFGLGRLVKRTIEELGRPSHIHAASPRRD